ncbi:GNAT family N-acetyltransferase [Nocardioides daphniae]|uniref:GNAT family N-acetyltransferase n=1 Tax=Nocardioides daphniae TaxID=402297 RepID=A0A4P7UEH1_9ACTN|nr:GNAT family N-acetyltransferase [Nocardioides daphniae]QCC78536.1 GNAT family N-acetyltransferase [Nocardioides daphniae]GGD11575.1 GNAT family N-acetyltransferase [Nocardioides daphniae]
MARRTLDLDTVALRELRPETGTCLRWKYDAVTAATIPDERAGEALEEWVAEVEEHWGVCGQLLVVDDAPCGYVLYAPPTFLPGLGDVPTAPASPDAVVLAELALPLDAARAADGKRLIQAMARDLVTRDVPAIEAFGTHGGGDDDVRARCLQPIDFLESVGFTTHRAHSTTPRLRMELRATRTWRSEVESAWERLVGAVRPAMKPGLRPPAMKPEAGGLRSDPRAP